MAKKQTERKQMKRGSRKTAKPVTPAKKEAPDTVAPVAAPRAPDPRLPPPGTLLQKKDRHGAVRCECAVEEGGIRYGGTIYKSLSAAAMAAAKDLGLANKTQNGFAFWDLSKPTRRTSDPLVALDRAWERYRGGVEALLMKDTAADTRAQISAAISQHAQAIEQLREKVA